MFKVWPVKYSVMKVTSTESGMATAMISVLVTLRRNIRITAAARTDPSMAWSMRFLMDCRMYTD